MKKLVAFALFLSLGLFCVVGCEKPKDKPVAPKGGTPAVDKKDTPKADATKTDPKADAPKADAPKKP
jgi:hypothetical protein